MATVNVGKCRSLIDIERIIWKIERSKESDRYIFPVNALKARHSPMHDAARLQMVVTLARQRLQSDFLDVHPNSAIDAAIEGLCSYSPGIAGIRLARGIRLGDIKIDRRDALKGAIAKMQATDSEKYNQVISGRSLDLICVSGSKIQYLRPLFEANRLVKEKSEMQKTMQSLVSLVNQESKDKIPDSLIHSLSLFTSELIKNTQEHATSDHAGKPYLAHVEGMILGWTRFSEKVFSDDFSGNSALKAYWNIESKKMESGVTSLRAFEVSYFDSGPGLVSRFKRRRVDEMSLEEERGFLIECLKYKSTSKSEDAAGEGLPSVLSELRKVGGLVRIRSGRLSVFNAFERGEVKRGLFDFQDWSDTPLAPVEGAVISIIVPLRGE